MISLTTVRTGSVPEERARRVFEVAGGDFGGKLMVTRATGRAVREALEEALVALPRGGVLYVDTRGVELNTWFSSRKTGTCWRTSRPL
jgi:hypothetical protein